LDQVSVDVDTREAVVLDHQPCDLAIDDLNAARSAGAVRLRSVHASTRWRARAALSIDFSGLVRWPIA
jgi:hypothetical protein